MRSVENVRGNFFEQLCELLNEVEQYHQFGVLKVEEDCTLLSQGKKSKMNAQNNQIKILESRRNILIKGECNKWYNTEIKIAKRNMRQAEKKYRQHKTNELKYNELRRLHQINCELVTRTKALYYKKLNGCGNDSSKSFGQINILLGQNKNSNILPNGKLPLP